MIFASEKIRRAEDLPEGWQAYRLEVVGKRHIRMDGGVYPEKFTRGPLKGRPKYKNPAPGTERTIVVSDEEYREMLADPINARPKSQTAA